MHKNESEYREIFLAEAFENHTSLNHLLTIFEKNPKDKATVDAIFRITHTLKGNALGMGYQAVADLSHSLEDFFGSLRENKLMVDTSMIASVFKAVDTLAELLQAVSSGKSVSYRGVKTKLDVLVKKANAETQPTPEAEEEPTSATVVEAEEIQVDPESETEATKVESNGFAFSDLVQVPVRKLDNLMTLVGELIIEKDRFMASQIGSRNEFNRLHRIASDLQYSVMDVRLVQVGFLFNKFHRVVRDAASVENKKVTLKLYGTETEIDRNVLQVISDSLIHLIRNCVGHGIEKPEDRRKQGKPEEGTVSLTATSESDAVIIEVRDDGRGINIERVRQKAIERQLIDEQSAAQMSDHDIIMLIFEPGFSTAEQVNEISGRGVGMDVVKKALNSIGGSVEVETKPGEGSVFRLTLPSSMAVKSTLLFELSHQTYAIPLSFTESVVLVYAKDVHKVGTGLVADYQGRNITIVFLKDILAGPSALDDERILQRGIDNLHPEERLNIVVISSQGRTVGFVVDKLLQQKEIVEKPLAPPVDVVSYISGVTILGTGAVCLVLNVGVIINSIFNLNIKSRTLKI